MSLRLEADGLAPLPLNRLNGIVVGSYERTMPEVRVVSEPRTDAHGDIDRSEYFGGSLVTLSISIVPTPTLTKRQVQDRLNQFCRPSLRPYLYIDSEDDGDERRILLRADSFSGPLTIPTIKSVQYQWRAPEGVEEAAEATLVSVDATPGVEPGRSYPLVYPRVYATGSPLGTIDVDNTGIVPVYPIVRLYGPCTNPRVENQTNDQRLEFTNLILGAGEFIQVDTKERTVYLANNTTQSRYDRLVFEVSDFWALEPGVNTIRYYPEVFDVGCHADVEFHQAWL